MNVLITGGAGFIGSHLADALLRRGDTVCVIDNYSTGRRDNLSPNPRLTVVEGTIADAARTASAFERSRPQVVVHAAASYKDPDNWAEDCLTNVLGTVNVIKAAKQIGVRRLIYFQTSLCYGLRPIEQPITLKHPIAPEGSSYTLSKTVAEQYIHFSGMEYISLRLANVYGPRNLSGPLPTFYQRLTSGKACFVVDTRRDFIYVNDLIDVVIPAIDGKGRSGPYHVSSGSDYAIKELFDETVKALGVKLDREVEVRPRNADDVSTILLDPSQTHRDFAWKTTTPLSAGVEKAIEWYKRHGISQTYTHLKQSDAKSIS